MLLYLVLRHGQVTREVAQAQETNFHQKESSEFVGKTRSGHIYFSLITCLSH